MLNSKSFKTLFILGKITNFHQTEAQEIRTRSLTSYELGTKRVVNIKMKYKDENKIVINEKNYVEKILSLRLKSTNRSSGTLGQKVIF